MPPPSTPRHPAGQAATPSPTPAAPSARTDPTPTGSPPAETRIERDSLGEVAVPAQALWGAQTQRSLHHFAIGAQPMPARVVRALAWVKWAAARAHADLQQLPAEKAQAIADAAWAVAAGEYAQSFPLSVWQTGSGTQTNMNVNEVIAHLASQALGGGLGAARTVHPNDEVNRGQSSNDVFPTAMHLAAALAVRDELLPALDALHGTLAGHAERWADIVKVGRTHGQDATPITLGQAFSAQAAQLALARQGIVHTLPALHQLAIGGTAVGTGLNTHPDFGARVCALLAQQHDLPLRQAANLFAAMAGHEALAALHGSLRTLAVALMKIGNDIRLLGSGPRAGLGELALPANEPGSSIMPGKVNPTQVEALTMVCAQVMGHDVAVGIGASQGQFELNAYKPLIIHNVLDSLQLLSDAMRSFDAHCARGLQPVPARIEELLSRSLMLVTALTPHIGYDRAARIAKQAHEQGGTLRDAALADGVAAADFDTWVDPHKMLSPRA